MKKFEEYLELRKIATLNNSNNYKILDVMINSALMSNIKLYGSPDKNPESN